MNEKTPEQRAADAYRNGVRDQLEALIAHATIGVMVGRAAMPQSGAMTVVAAGITQRTMRFWMQELSAIPDEALGAVFSEARQHNEGRSAPICGRTE